MTIPSQCGVKALIVRSRDFLFWVVLVVAALSAAAQTANTPERINRPLRYTPDGTGFVITNGTEYFNRPLYCGNTGFRIDGGDRPEFSFYLPGHGGNLRFGLDTGMGGGPQWLDKSWKIITRYRPGALDYEIGNGVKGEADVMMTVLPLSEGKGLVGRVLIKGHAPVPTFFMAFGGVDGMKGRRGGDIGCEKEPVGTFFQLRPEQCRNNQVASTGGVFNVRGPGGVMEGMMGGMPLGNYETVVDAKGWAQLFIMARRREFPAKVREPIETPVVLEAHTMIPNQPFYFVVRQVPEFLTAAGPLQKYPTDPRGGLGKIFDEAEEHRRAIAERIVVTTPDPFINTAAAALNVAADAVWDEKQQSFMHGAVAWRNRLLGWRGPYAGDALGWHERTAAHIAGFAKQQNTNPVPEKLPPADADANLSRSEAALHSNGNLGKNHYDMNLVAMDALLRHLLWTGDREFAERMWPVLERHLAWERRLFRREFGPDKLPLYEGYACIWASDDLAYNGGGAAHSSAYNAYHNRMAARVAHWLGKDATPYEREAGLIVKGMRQHLWLPREGCFAEWKDLLGLQLPHPNPALWTFYHTLDSEVPTPLEAWRMSRFVDTQFPRIPVRSPAFRRLVTTGEPDRLKAELRTQSDEECFTLPTSTWMPYTWSLNNVVMAESMHTSLAYWQANRADAAFPLFKGALLDSMFLGLCPGNVGMCTAYDAYRGESQRDFADGVGATSRALIEGLFGVKPDAIAGELQIRPGFPADWNHASLKHPDLTFSFKRDGLVETYVVESRFKQPMALRLNVAALRNGIDGVTVNGVAAGWRDVAAGVGWPRVEIRAAAAVRQELKIVWKGGPVRVVEPEITVGRSTLDAGSETGAPMDWRSPRRASFGSGFFISSKSVASTNLEALNLSSVFNDWVTNIFRHEYLTPRSPFTSLAMPKQGIGSWCHPKETFGVNDSGLRAIAAKGGGKIVLPNGIPLSTPGDADSKNIAFVSQWDNFPREILVPVSGRSSHAYLLMAGSTSAMQSRFDNGEVVVTYDDGSTARLALRNPGTWWPIDQDYFIDDFAFRWAGPLPPRVDLKTGQVRVLDLATFKGRGGAIPGGAATVLHLPLDATKELKSLTVRALANEVVIGLMSVTLER